MNTNLTPNTELLIQYLDDELAPEEKRNLEEKLKVDEELRKELEHLSLAVKAVKNYGLKEKVSGIHQDMMKQLKPEKKYNQPGTILPLLRVSLRIAASLFLLMLGYGIYTYLRLSPDTIFPSDINPYHFRATREGEINEIQQLYNHQDYKKVLSMMEESRPLEVTEQFLAANSYFGLNEFEKAAEYFTSILKNKESGMFVDESQYYLALCDLKLNNAAKALDLLISIKQNEGHRYHDKVSSTLILKAKMLKNKTNSK